KMHLKRLAGCIGGEMGEIKENILVVLNQYAAGAQASPHSEDECYWYHPDHLGSASWVSDKAGKGIQHLYYLPWGEELDNQRATDYASRYTFSGKERDEETGYGYFGARYYNSDLSIWLSVDPMADKYPGVSPYTYCANNPVRLVDPDGRTWETPEDEEKANRMRRQAEDGISWNNSRIQKYKSQLAHTTNRNQQIRLQNKINEFEERNDYLQYGIWGLNQMEESLDFSFHFSSVNRGEICFSEITPYDGEDLSTGIITIYSDSYTSTRWHECTHVWDWMSNYFGEGHFFDPCDRILKHYESLNPDVENHALQSEFAYSAGRNHRGMTQRNIDRFDGITLFYSRSIFDVDVDSYIKKPK
ncbi:MAG: RHS repeat-associated core domain-containing protein, partial [Bacteroidales bacterium]|nr:RHS repeat-associated core domain-containing protein [Bacteroidales bacterium]